MSDSAYSRIEQSPVLRPLYEALLAAVSDCGAYEVDYRKSHLEVSHDLPFLAVSPRGEALLLTLMSDHPLIGARLHDHSAGTDRRWHQQVLIDQLSDIDTELREWLMDAYPDPPTMRRSPA